MHPRRNLHTVIRSILNSMQFMLPIIARGLYLTASPAQAMPFNYSTNITPPLKINLAFVSNYTDFSLVSRATSGHPAHKHTFFIQLNKPLGMLHRAFAEGIFAVWFFLAVRFPYMWKDGVFRCRFKDLAEECWFLRFGRGSLQPRLFYNVSAITDFTIINWSSIQ